MTVPKKTLDDGSRIAGAVTTPFKYLSSIFDGYAAWESTGCDASGIGRPVREAQLSTDGLWTVDVAISSLTIQGEPVLPGRYVRLEIFPGRPSHESVAAHAPQPSDVIQFQGPLMWDKDVDDDHPHGHMEMHPIGAINFSVKERPSPVLESTKVVAGGSLASEAVPSSSVLPTGESSEYEVVAGDNLSVIAARLYGSQRWPPVF